jgi:hypothetical protein
VSDEKRCPDCGVEPGQLHEDGCDVARCRLTGEQRLQCDHTKEDGCNTAWEGEWPGLEECRELGWYAALVPGRGWVECGPNDEGACEDLNRLIIKCVWDIEKQRMVLP